MLSQVEKVLFKFFHMRLCDLAQKPTIQEVLHDLREQLDVSDEQIDNADAELFGQVRQLLHVQLSSHEKFFMTQLCGARRGTCEYGYLSDELTRIRSAQSLCRL